MSLFMWALVISMIVVNLGVFVFGVRIFFQRRQENRNAVVARIKMEQKMIEGGKL